MPEDVCRPSPKRSFGEPWNDRFRVASAIGGVADMGRKRLRPKYQMLPIRDGGARMGIPERTLAGAYRRGGLYPGAVPPLSSSSSGSGLAAPFTALTSTSARTLWRRSLMHSASKAAYFRSRVV